MSRGLDPTISGLSRLVLDHVFARFDDFSCIDFEISRGKNKQINKKNKQINKHSQTQPPLFVYRRVLM